MLINSHDNHFCLTAFEITCPIAQAQYLSSSLKFGPNPEIIHFQIPRAYCELAFGSVPSYVQLLMVSAGLT